MALVVMRLPQDGFAVVHYIVVEVEHTEAVDHFGDVLVGCMGDIAVDRIGEDLQLDVGCIRGRTIDIGS